MRLLSTLPLVGHIPPGRPSLLPLVLARNASRLHSIHEGLLRSERARPQGPSFAPKLEIRQPPTEAPYLSPAERRRARVVARQNPITYKIKKAGKNIVERQGPGRLQAGKRYKDPRDPKGAGSLLKKFKTGQLVEELSGAGKSSPDHIQPEDFTLQMLSGDVEDLMNSRKFPRPAGSSKTKSHYTSRWEDEPPSRGARAGGFDRTIRGGRDAHAPSRDATFERDSFDKTSRGGRAEHAPTREATSDRNSWNDRDGDRRPREKYDGGRAGRERGTPRDDDRPVRDRRNRDAPHDADRFDRSDRRAPDREVSYGARDYETSGRVQRDSGSSRPRTRDQRSDELFSVEPTESGPADPRNGNVGQGVDEKEEKVKKIYTPPASVPYTTAASQFLYGTSTVQAALSTSRRKLYKLYIYSGANRTRKDKDEYLAKLAFDKGVPVEWVGEDKAPMLEKMSTYRPHNGYVLEASPLPQLPVQALGEVSDKQGWPGFKVERGYQSAEDAAINGSSDFITTELSTHKPFVLFLDEIVDPMNLGAIIRTASFMGVSAVVTSKRNSAPVTPTVLKASSGAAETITILSVDSPVDFLSQSKVNGWKVYAAVPPKGDATRQKVDMHHIEKYDPLLEDPCILVLGSEGEGLSRQLRKCANTELSIPNMSGSTVVDSLNVSVATALLCSAFVRGRSLMLNDGRGNSEALF